MTVDLWGHIRDINDFPKEGVTFKDITPLLGDPVAFEQCVEAMGEPFAEEAVTKICGTEARGFILAAPLALSFGAGFVPVRKAGKLPWEVERQSYDLEYGTDLLEIHRDAIAPGERVLVVDDVLATGGTAAATAALVEKLGGQVVGFSFLMELEFLNGRQHLGDKPVASLLTVT